VSPAIVFRLFFEEKLQFAPVLPSTYGAAALSPVTVGDTVFSRIRSGFAPFDLKQQRPNRCRWPMVLGEE
jgi:hypothetical protein